MATLLNQQSAKLKKIKECNIRLICAQQLFRSFRAYQHSTDQMKILKAQRAQNTTGAVGVEYNLWIPFAINRVQSAQLNKVKDRNIRSILYIYCCLIILQFCSFLYYYDKSTVVVYPIVFNTFN